MTKEMTPTSHPRRVSAQRDRGPRLGTKARGAAFRAGLRAATEAARERAPKTKVIAVRVTDEQIEKLGLLGALAPAVNGNSAALARAVEIAFEAAVVAQEITPDDIAAASAVTGDVAGGVTGAGNDTGDNGGSATVAATAAAGHDAAEGKEWTETLSLDAARVIADALQAWTTAYNDAAKQLRAVGHQNNQLVKLGHQAVTYGRDAVIPADAVSYVGQVVEQALDQLAQHAVRDARIEQVIRECLRRS